MAAADVNTDVVMKLRREIILVLIKSGVEKLLSFSWMGFVSDARERRDEVGPEYAGKGRPKNKRRCGGPGSFPVPPHLASGLRAAG
jgi:hypothetical protein